MEKNLLNLKLTYLKYRAYNSGNATRIISRTKLSATSCRAG